jgi:hypothetical protein
MLVSEIKDLSDLIGKKVRTTQTFYDVPGGTEGKVVGYGYSSEPYSRNNTHQWIMIEWGIRSNGGLMAEVGRDAGFDETQWLEMI